MAYRNRDVQHSYSVSSGIPIAPGKYRKRLYPFGTMEIGDSFPLADNSYQEVDRVRAAAQEWQRRHSPMKFAVRQVDPTTKEYRCWRIA